MRFSIFSLLIIYFVMCSHLLYFKTRDYRVNIQNKRGPIYGFTSINKKHNYIVKITDGNGVCSGFVVDRNYVITAAHCIGFFSRKFLVFNSYMSIAKLVGMDRGLDIAVLSGDFSKFSSRRSKFYTNGMENKKEKYKACGYPRGQRFLYCAKLKLDGKHGNFNLAMGDIFHGMSGGPVVDQDGNVVGVISAIMKNNGKAVLSNIIGIPSIFGISP